MKRSGRIEINSKKYRIVFCILTFLLPVLTLALVAVDLFLFCIPQVVFYLFTAVSAAVCLLFFRCFHGRKFFCILSIVFVILITGAATLSIYINPYFNSVSMHSYGNTDDYDTFYTYKEATEDLAYIIRSIEQIHPIAEDAFPAVMTEAYNEQLQLLSGLSSIALIDVWRAAETILSSISDAHTACYPYFAEPHYLRTVQQNRDLNRTLIAINGESLSELVQNRSGLFSYEMQSYAAAGLGNKVIQLEWMTYFGYDLSSGVTYRYEDSDGQSYEETCYTEDFITLEEYYTLYDMTASSYVPWEYSIHPEEDYAVLTLDSCNYSREYCRLLADFFTEVKENGIDYIAVDLRGNGGGNSMVANEFLRYLDIDSYNTETFHWRLGRISFDVDDNPISNDRFEELIFTGDLYVLTDTVSFSSAMLFAQYVTDNELGTLIGEAPGNNPNGYGDIVTLQLPNSSLLFCVSTKRFTRADPSNGDVVSPDIYCDGDLAFEVFLDTIVQ